MLGTVGAPTLIDLCCGESVQEVEMTCCVGMVQDEPCCESDLSFDSIDGEFHKAEAFVVQALKAREIHGGYPYVQLDDPKVTLAQLQPGIPLPDTPTNERLSVFLI